MGAMKAMKAMKVMKAKKIISAKLARKRAFSGKLAKTKTGLTKADFIKNENGKIVSRKASAASKKRFAKGLGRWVAAVSKARKELGLKGFVAIKKGSAFYKKAQELYSQ